jgi:catechol 2,3-dioxygenase-like lactoylglutathione lyase family enzyme
MADFKVAQLDHVHVYVADRYAAAEWYRCVLGLEVVARYESWAADPDGPLSISPDDGNTDLALFQRANPVPPKQRATIAFRVDGAGFMAFLGRLNEYPVCDHSGTPLTAQDVVDHEHSFSLYFCDPDGNPYELTTYDYAVVAERIRGR